MTSDCRAATERMASTSAPARSRLATIRRSWSRFCETARKRRRAKCSPSWLGQVPRFPPFYPNCRPGQRLQVRRNPRKVEAVKPRLLAVDDEPDMLDFLERVF